jgi:hypothetical protein
LKRDRHDYLNLATSIGARKRPLRHRRLIAR